MQLASNANAGTRHRPRAAETCTRTVVAASASPLRDLRLYDGPGRRPILPPRIEDDRGGAASHAVKVQARSVAGRHDMPRACVEIVAGCPPRRALHPQKRTDGERAQKRLHRRVLFRLRYWVSIFAFIILQIEELRRRWFDIVNKNGRAYPSDAIPNTLRFQATTFAIRGRIFRHLDYEIAARLSHGRCLLARFRANAHKL